MRCTVTAVPEEMSIAFPRFRRLNKALPLEITVDDKKVLLVPFDTIQAAIVDEDYSRRCCTAICDAPS